MTGKRTCSEDHLATTCPVADETGPAPTAEVCNGIDDDCDGVVDVTAAGVSVCVSDAGVDASIPDAAAPPPADAGAVDAGTSEDDLAGANVDGCSCRAAGGGGLGVGALGLAGIAIVSLVGRRRRR